MSEARLRKNDHFHSSIFDSPSPAPSFIPSNKTLLSNKYRDSSIFKESNPQIRWCSSPTKEKPHTHSISQSPVKSSYAQNPRTSNSYKSTAFEATENKAYKPNPFKPKDNIVFGTDTIEYPANTPVKIFEPVYSDIDPYQKKQMELYGITNPKESPPQVRCKSTDPRTRKNEELNSQVFESSSYEKAAVEEKIKEKVSFTPQTRKAEMLSSSVFGESTIVVPESLPKKQEIEKRHQLSSNIFGERKDYVPRSKIIENKPNHETL